MEGRAPLVDVSVVKCSECVLASFSQYGIYCTEWGEDISDETVASQCEAFSPNLVRSSEMEKQMGNAKKRAYSRTVDSIPVDANLGRISGRFEVLEADASRMLFDDDVMIVIIGRMTAPGFAEGKSGELARVNIIKPREARVVRDEKLKAKLLDSLDFDIKPEKSLLDAGDAEDDEDDEVSPISFDSDSESVTDAEPVEPEPEPEPEPEESGLGEEDESWTEEDEQAALREFLEEKTVKRPIRPVDSSGHSYMRKFLSEAV